MDRIIKKFCSLSAILRLIFSDSHFYPLRLLNHEYIIPCTLLYHGIEESIQRLGGCAAAVDHLSYSCKLCRLKLGSAKTTATEYFTPAKMAENRAYCLLYPKQICNVSQARDSQSVTAPVECFCESDHGSALCEIKRRSHSALLRCRKYAVPKCLSLA